MLKKILIFYNRLIWRKFALILTQVPNKKNINHNVSINFIRVIMLIIQMTIIENQLVEWNSSFFSWVPMMRYKQTIPWVSRNNNLFCRGIL